MADRYELFFDPDDVELPLILFGSRLIARALTKRDGTLLVEELNGLLDTKTSSFRDKLLSAVTDAVEECFEE